MLTSDIHLATSFLIFGIFLYHQPPLHSSICATPSMLIFETLCIKISKIHILKIEFSNYHFSTANDRKLSQKIFVFCKKSICAFWFFFSQLLTIWISMELWPKLYRVKIEVIQENCCVIVRSSIYLLKTDVGGSNIIFVPGQYKVNAKKIRIKYDKRSQGRRFPFLAFLGTFYYVKCLNFTSKNQIFLKKS